MWPRPDVIITPSSDIYPSNRPTGVNIWREVTMIWFDLLNHIKEVEPKKHTIHTFHNNNKTLRNYPNLSDNQPLSPTEFLDQLTPGHSHDIGMHASKRLWMLPKHGMPTSKDYFSQWCAIVLGIWATFSGLEPRRLPRIQWYLHNKKITREWWYKCNYLNKPLIGPLLAMAGISLNISKICNLQV